MGTIMKTEHEVQNMGKREFTFIFAIDCASATEFLTRRFSVLQKYVSNMEDEMNDTKREKPMNCKSPSTTLSK
jgi:hypothetical protein